LAAMESSVAERLFFVCSQSAPPLYTLKDVFSRFGNLIDIYMLSGKNCGYAKYSDKESADKAVACLHGQGSILQNSISAEKFRTKFHPLILDKYPSKKQY
jgi:hypothetical protein